MKRSKEQLEQAKEIIIGYLQESNNNPHEAYDNYIKYYLASGSTFPECIQGIKDFIKYSKPETEQVKTKKQYNRKQNTDTEYKMTMDDIVTELKRSISLYEDMQKYYTDKGEKESAKSAWASLQSYKIMLCKILGQEYICINLP